MNAGGIALILCSTLLQAQSRDTFRRSVYPALESAQCRDCHKDNGVASATRLRFPPEDALPEAIDAFGLTLRALVDAQQPDKSPLLLRPTNRVAHPGGERIKRGSPEEQLLKQWIGYLATIPESAGARAGKSPTVLPSILRRLTNSQYNNTVADLLGDRTRPANHFPAEDFIHGFTNQAAGQSISPLLAEEYSKAATRLALNARRTGTLDKLARCRTVNAQCAAEFVRTFGLRAFRRPVESIESGALEKLLLTEAKRKGSFLDGAQLTVEAMLQSPAFLFHTAQGPYGVASRLSYFLWDTAPDGRLLQLAETGRLNRPEEIEREIRRMLADDRARPAMNQFLAQWLRFDRLRGALRDRKLFPEYGVELVSAMIQETTLLYEHLVWNNQNFLDLFTARYSFLNSSLARLYSVPSIPGEFAQTAFPENSQRAGILGHASILTLTSKPEDTSPTERGLFIREHFLCQSVPPPPPGVDTTLPALSEEKPLNNRDRLAIHLSNSGCAACHRLVDPIGFGFEKFDAIGRHREKQTVLVYPAIDKMKRNTRREGIPVELAVDTAGTIVGLPKSDFSNPRELGQMLASQPTCQRCIVKQLFRYALGRMETEADQIYIDEAFRRFRESGFKFQELVIAVASSKPFLDFPALSSVRSSDAH